MPREAGSGDLILLDSLLMMKKRDFYQKMEREFWNTLWVPLLQFITEKASLKRERDKKPNSGSFKLVTAFNT